MEIIETSVTYINENDLFLSSKYKMIDEITLYDVKDKNIIRKSNILILKLNGKYKVLKSRY